ncbi:hypothetical protein BU25DRAFT_415188 [Macroventuria anomochaeta]|uniref:Uncharacterized protein n=1 Tax=Macroventuria anomochaeta TaxID=301207 RepID=A0ACB6RKK4_9PLEO|nr:uncharacterized protein BU25DRAFT_415188 [Macroventuria anomochaeta]KAF2622455.1 hypothetical protein BU25DRAFT_415188 [Macroventuria anomochaeta]
MDAKGKEITTGSEKSWLTSDFQVVLWFVLLCCLFEGIATGFRWWRGPPRLVTERRRVDKKTDRRGPEKVDETDEDDEDNIPVL